MAEQLLINVFNVDAALAVGRAKDSLPRTGSMST